MIAQIVWVEVPFLIFGLLALAGCTYMIFWGIHKHKARLIAGWFWVVLITFVQIGSAIDVQMYEYSWLWWFNMLITFPLSILWLRNEIKNGEEKDASRASRR